MDRCSKSAESSQRREESEEKETEEKETEEKESVERRLRWAKGRKVGKYRDKEIDVERGR